MSKTITCWTSLNNELNNKNLRDSLKNYEPKLEFCDFYRDDIKNHTLLLVFTSLSDVKLFLTQKNEEKTDITADNPVLIIDTNDKVLAEKIESKLLEAEAYVSYVIDTTMSDAEKSMSSLVDLASELAMEEGNFKTLNYWINRTKELCAFMSEASKLSNKDKEGWLIERAENLAVFNDIYKRNKVSGSTGLKIQIQKTTKSICAKYGTISSYTDQDEEKGIELAMKTIMNSL